MLEVNNVSYCYKSREIDTLKDISFHIEAGEMVLIAGRTGCGKSTLLKVINGLLAATSQGDFRGVVRINGENIVSMSPESLGLMVGTVYQSPDDQLFAMTVEDEVGFVLENQGYSPEYIAEQVSITLEKVGLAGFEKRSVHALSGGQRQRLALASVLVSKPHIVILDEPVSQMNPYGVWDFLNILAKLNQEDGITFLVVEHRVHELAEFFPRLLLLNQGKLIYDGAIEEAWGVVGGGANYGLREPQTVALCRELGLPRLTMKMEATVTQIQEHCQLTTEVLPCVDKQQGQEAIRTQLVRYTYNGSANEVLKGVDFQVFAGEKLALMGTNGAGKSTLLNLLVGLVEQQDGSIEILQGTVEERAFAVGFMRQDPDLMLVADTVAQEIAWGNKSITPQQVQATMELLDLAPMATDFPLALSKGQRLRVVLAGILARKPQMIILDEPTTGQDKDSLDDIEQIVEDYVAQGGTVVFCTHDVELAATMADRVAVLHQGVIEKIGTPREVFGQVEDLQQWGLMVPPMLTLSRMLGIPPCVTVKEVEHYVHATAVGR